MTNKTYIAFLWHHHQPYYKDDLTGNYILPWVRFHAIKDYYDTVAILDDFPKIKMNFNLVPSLLLQIQDYVENNARDEYWHLAVKKVNELTLDDKISILKKFFSCNWSTMIDIYPRYKKLLDIRGRTFTEESLRKIASNLDGYYFLDLQVWFNLTWIDPYFRDKDDFLKKLFKKGEGFSESEKNKLLEKHIDIMRMIIPKYKEVLARKQIEISTTPFYHPILPLLIDSSISKISSPHKSSPKNIFSHPEDAKIQLEKGIKYYQDIFGETPAGIWPSEGSVSNDVLKMLADMGIKWVGSDEDIFFNSSKSFFQAQNSRNDLYNVFKYKSENLSLLFRDKRLSDLIGFSYSQMNADSAVQNFMDNIRNIKNNLHTNSNDTNLITVILDGENCWEYFEEDGNKFLRKLYEALENSSDFETTTISEYIQKFPPNKVIDSIFPGSWINHNFDIWIGDKEDNKAWDLLYKTRDFLLRKQSENNAVSKISDENFKNAWEEIYIAEGSDWFWWYGDTNSSVNDLEFDMSFRQHLKNVYIILGEEIPIELEISIIEQKHDKLFYPPLGCISPVIDGKSTNFFEWYNAGYYDPENSNGAMHRVTNLVKKFYYGFDYDSENFYFRIDTSSILKSNGKDIIFVLEFNNKSFANIKFDHKLNKYILEIKEFADKATTVKFENEYIAVDQCLELKIPLKYFENFNKIGFMLKVFESDFEIERWPQQDKLYIDFPNKK
jgi:alpha-amylase/alpha-mannosidase (GH57 family)